MILRPEFRVLNGNHPVLLVRKGRVSQDPTSRWWLCFLTLMELCELFVPRNTTVKSEYYEGLLERLRKDVRRKRPENWADGFILHHDNAPCHTSLLVRQFLSNKNITVCPHPPQSPDLEPCDFSLFPKVKITMKGKRFESIQDIEAATTAQLKTLMKRTSRTASASGKNDGISVFEVGGGGFWEGLMAMCLLL